MRKPIDERLFGEFPAIETKVWEEKILAGLNVAGNSEKITWDTGAGLDFKPFYRKEDLDKIPNFNPNGIIGLKAGNSDNNWLARHDIEVADCRQANQKALVAIAKGAQSIGFGIGPEQMPANEMAALLDRIELEIIEINFCGKISKETFLQFLEFAESKNINPKNLKASFGFNPLCQKDKGNNKNPGDSTFSYNDLLEILALSGMFPKIRLIGLWEMATTQAQTSLTEKMACFLSLANEYLSKLSSSNTNLGAIVSRFMLNMETCSSYFVGIAKLRAARLLWENLVTAYGIDKPNAKIVIHTTTSTSNKPESDPFSNMPRTTTEAMAAILGGTDSLSIQVTGNKDKTNSDFLERIALNQQNILKHESFLDKTLDPSAGSYYIEILTNSIAAKTWEKFQEIEAKGGYQAVFGNTPPDEKGLTGNCT